MVYSSVYSIYHSIYSSIYHISNTMSVLISADKKNIQVYFEEFEKDYRNQKCSLAKQGCNTGEPGGVWLLNGLAYWVDSYSLYKSHENPPKYVDTVTNLTIWGQWPQMTPRWPLSWGHMWAPNRVGILACHYISLWMHKTDSQNGNKYVDLSLHDSTKLMSNK